VSTQPQRKRPTRRGLAFAAVYGMVVTTIAYAIARGNPFWMLVVMIIIGIAFRLCAYRLIRRRGDERPPWWRWL
jgi:hypothetical protein